MNVSMKSFVLLVVYRLFFKIIQIIIFNSSFLGVGTVAFTYGDRSPCIYLLTKRPNW